MACMIQLKDKIMNKEEKELLLQDLCARLPYGVFVEDGRNKLDDGPVIYTANYHPYINDCKPYLRPMESMTEEEQKEFVQFHCVKICPIVITDMLTLDNESKMFDWLNANRFDFRGLIPMGLALPAPEGMYND